MLDADQLQRQYGSWGSHPEHSVSDWQHEVANDETRLGYWDWLVVELEMATEDSIKPDPQ